MIASGNSRAKIVTGFTAMMFAVISAVMKRAVITTNHGAYPARGAAVRLASVAFVGSGPSGATFYSRVLGRRVAPSQTEMWSSTCGSSR